ncbi:MAG: hypothetical protein CL910_03765 [Deltaproteobacteria bacterium]|jgi:hypothetical protein|nr:hypothetical protein [Deltaproteobacteria bacterium]
MTRWLGAAVLALAMACQDAATRLPPPPEAGILRGIEVPWTVLREPGFRPSVRWLAENGFDHLRVELPPDPEALARLLALTAEVGLGLVVGLADDASPGDWEAFARALPEGRARLWLLLPEDADAAAEALAIVRRRDGERIVVGPNPGEPRSLLGLALGPDLAQASATLEAVGAAARERGIPVYCRSLGLPTTAEGSERDAYYDDLIAALEAHGIPWSLSDARGEADVLDDRGYLIPGVMAALGRDRPEL